MICYFFGGMIVLVIWGFWILISHCKDLYEPISFLWNVRVLSVEIHMELDNDDSEKESPLEKRPPHFQVLTSEKKYRIVQCRFFLLDNFFPKPKILKTTFSNTQNVK